LIFSFIKPSLYLKRSKLPLSCWGERLLLRVTPLAQPQGSVVTSTGAPDPWRVGWHPQLLLDVSGWAEYRILCWRWTSLVLPGTHHLPAHQRFVL
jgi:hypothetical protein